jgi:hypothetical protein
MKHCLRGQEEVRVLQTELTLELALKAGALVLEMALVGDVHGSQDNAASSGQSKKQAQFRP